MQENLILFPCQDKSEVACKRNIWWRRFPVPAAGRLKCTMGYVCYFSLWLRCLDALHRQKWALSFACSLGARRLIYLANYVVTSFESLHISSWPLQALENFTSIRTSALRVVGSGEGASLWRREGLTSMAHTPTDTHVTTCVWRASFDMLARLHRRTPCLEFILSAIALFEL